MTVEESNETSKKTSSSQFESTNSAFDIANFIKTYGLESSLGNLKGSLESSILKKNSTKMEQWIIIAHKLAEHLQQEQNKYHRLERQLQGTKS